MGPGRNVTHEWVHDCMKAAPMHDGSQSSPGSFWRPASGRSFALVVAGAAMWGTDPLFRSGLTTQLPAASIVLIEHLLPVVLVVPLAVRGIKRARASFAGRDWITLAILGLGSSALATVMFTVALTIGFAHENATTPVLLQQIQPVVAIAAAWLVLRERPRPLFGLFLIGGLVGAYLIAFKDPTGINPLEWQPALLSLGAALLWGLGTVLSRRLSSLLPFGELTALRLVVGLIAAIMIAGSRDEIAPLLSLDLPSWSALVALALVPGLFSLLVYYRGLRGTPASAATIGELSFPLTALLVGFVALHESLSASQWVGVLVLAATVTAMGTTKPHGIPTAVSVTPVHAAVREMSAEP